MTNQIRLLSEESRKLSPAERIELIDDILDSLLPPDPDLTALWTEEAKDRLVAYRRDEIEAFNMEDVFLRHRIP